MPNVAAVLKDEIARIARKEVRSETLRLKRASGQHRTDVAELKRRVAVLEKQVARLGKFTTKKAAQAEVVQPASQRRFSAASLVAQRRRLGLSASEIAKLLGVSAQSVYKWEGGRTRPRTSQFAAIAALRGISKKAAIARLNQ
jgi:DNA-binding transcriptional regulator YiaG